MREDPAHIVARNASFKWPGRDLPGNDEERRQQDFGELVARNGSGFKWPGGRDLSHANAKRDADTDKDKTREATVDVRENLAELVARNGSGFKWPGKRDLSHAKPDSRSIGKEAGSERGGSLARRNCSPDECEAQAKRNDALE